MLLEVAMLWTILATLLTAVAPLHCAVLTGPVPDTSMRIHEKRTSIPKEFLSIGPATPNETLSLRVSLVQNDFSGLEEALYAVSTPGNERYRKFLAKEEVRSLHMYRSL